MLRSISSLEVTSMLKDPPTVTDVNSLQARGAEEYVSHQDMVSDYTAL